MYFLLFAGILLVLVGVLQIYFLNNYYESMKAKQTSETAAHLTSTYNNGDMNALIEEIQTVSDGDDLYIRVDQQGKVIYPATAVMSYQTEIGRFQSEVTQQFSDPSMNMQINNRFVTNNTTKQKAYVSCTILDNSEKIVMYVVSPVKPVKSTIIILQNQLAIIIVIALILAFLISLYISTRISRPIIRITKSAKRLADGEYGTRFPTSKRQYSEIYNLSQTLNKASQELAKTDLLQKDLMANVSHDLKTPLTMIKSYAEMIRDLSGDIPEKREAHLNVIIDEVDRLNILVQDVLTLSKMQSGTLELSRTDFDIVESMNTVLAPYRILEEQEGFHIHFVYKEDSLIVNGDEDRIKQVMSNLITNAIKYGGEDKQVFIKLHHWGRRVHVEVIDHGAGIKPEELDHIWDRYYKSSSNHARSSTGSGLGLSIVNEILTLHHAKFGVESKVGKGTTFWFELITPAPKDKEEDHQARRRYTQLIHRVDEQRAPGRKTSHRNRSRNLQPKKKHFWQS